MRMSLPGSCGLPGSVQASRTPLPLVSITSGVQPCDFSMSPVSSSILVLSQPTLPPPPPVENHNVSGFLVQRSSWLCLLAQTLAGIGMGLDPVPGDLDAPGDPHTAVLLHVIQQPLQADGAAGMADQAGMHSD